MTTSLAVHCLQLFSDGGLHREDFRVVNIPDPVSGVDISANMVESFFLGVGVYGHD